MELNAKILVLDDEPLVRLMVCSKLEHCGALVSEAGNCAEALGLARNTDFDAAVFDYRLPDGNGLDLVRMLRREGIGFPVVMLSGESVGIARDTEGEDGICAVLSKPPDMEAVAGAMVRAIGGTPSAESMRVGRYAYWKAGTIVAEASGEWAGAEWLAIDFSDVADAEPHPSVVECIRLSRQGIAVLGANAALRGHLSALGAGIEFVSSMDELAAVSRHPSSPSERAALLGVAIQRQ